MFDGMPAISNQNFVPDLLNIQFVSFFPSGFQRRQRFQRNSDAGSVESAVRNSATGLNRNLVQDST